MADDRHITNNKSDSVETAVAKEDAETTAARRELKQTTISEKAGQSTHRAPSDDDEDDASDSAPDDKNKDSAAARQATPDTDPGDVRDDIMLKEQVSSPKKKRGHDELVADGSSTAGEDSSKPTDAAVAQTRTEESEPEKKRPRDRDSATRRRSQDGAESTSTRSSLDKSSEAKGSTASTKGAHEDKSQTSASAFASSTFPKLASSTASPFALAGAGKPSLFGSSGSGSFSVLGGPKPAAPAPTAPKLSFGGSSTASPFALNGSKPSVFGGNALGGSGFGGGFGGSVLSGPRLSTFGKPGEPLKSDKPAKPFGAPESDNEESDKDDDEEEPKVEAGSDKDESKETDKDESKALTEEKKKIRLQKIKVDDGEGGEVTLLAVRAKMYHMEKGVGWKERGAGMLKVNVPRSTIEFDDYGNPEPSSFDASVLEDEDEEQANAKKNVRLIMRQDHTLRVILNTVVVPAMHFQLNQKLKAAFVLFTAFEDGEAKQVQMKLSEANATLFTQLMDMIQKSLSDV
ncbi:nucleoporin NUP56 [Podospora aff. communis PSN243]|uniref:Nucleoporin NUP56 n=1 Tax=Podospora aff. communis PSN243 TaxID=3040156 RepID=A0AAV9GRY8_9PEZI|nr:nucleoporin NUP56 [Podospora aff. communis PSN243]